MPRVARADAAGAAHHVMIRGIERRRIFVDEADRRDFVARLERLLPEEGWRCFAWALMPNHVHLVLQSSCGGLSRLMARLNTGYALSFNRRHRRVGYLFQNRFKSRLVEDDADLMGLVVYTHRNPLAAGIVGSAAELERFRWCGHGALVGSAQARRFEAVRACLSLFAEDPQLARKRVRASAEGPDSALEPRPLASERSPSVPRTAASAEPPPQEAATESHSLPPRRSRDGPDAERDLERLIAAVSERHRIPPPELRSPWGSRRAAQARAVVIYLAIDRLGIRGRTVANALGLSPAAVSQARRRGRRAASEADEPELLVDSLSAQTEN